MDKKLTPPLQSALTEAFNYLSMVVPNINYGGCGVFAELCYDFLKRLGFQPIIVILTRDPEWTNSAIQNGDLHFPLTHVVLMVDGRFIHSLGIHDDLEDVQRACLYHERYDAVTLHNIEQLRQWNTLPNFWHYMFDRSKIPLMKDFFETINLQQVA